MCQTRLSCPRSMPQNIRMKKIGRNDPCPCGSGKKYKQCCLKKDQPSFSPDELAARRIHREMEGLPERMMRFVAEAYGPDALDEAWNEFVLWNEANEGFDPDSPLLPVFLPWFFYAWSPDPSETDVADAALHEHKPAQAFLARRGRHLAAVARDYMQTCLASPFSFFEVARVEGKNRLGLRDLITDQEHQVHEKLASASLEPGYVVFAQPVDAGDVTLLEGLGPLTFSQEDKAPILALRRRIRDHADNDSPEAIRPRLFEWDLELRELFLDMTEMVLDADMPEMVTSDDEDLEFHEMTYDIASADMAFDALKDLHIDIDHPDVDPMPTVERNANGTLLSASIAWSNPKANDDALAADPLLGSLEIKGTILKASTASRERAERLKGFIEARLGDKAILRSDMIQTLDELMAEMPEKSPAPDLAGDPEVREVVTSYLRQHYIEWIDTALPSLDGKTPRDAVLTPDGREQVEALLLDAEKMDLGLTESNRETIFEDVRRQLGLVG